VLRSPRRAASKAYRAGAARAAAGRALPASLAAAGCLG